MNVMTDMRALSARRSRAEPDGMFLHAAVADEVKDRLNVVNKAFTAPVVVTDFPGFWRAEWPDANIVAATDTLDLTPGTHDLVLHLMGLHWANDPVGQLIQCRRALRPDGLLIVAAFGGETLNELRQCLGTAEIAVTGGLSPRVAPMADIRDMGGLMQRAGLALPVADIVPLSAAYEDPWHLMRDLRRMGETNALEGRLRRFTRRSVLTEAARLYTENFSNESGRITATFELIFLTGWAPDASQPQPLQPGSAQRRLADALNSSETPLRD